MERQRSDKCLCRKDERTVSCSRAERTHIARDSVTFTRLELFEADTMRTQHRATADCVWGLRRFVQWIVENAYMSVRRQDVGC